MHITNEMIDRKIKSIRHLLIDRNMKIKDLIEEADIPQRQLAQAMMGKNIQLWAFTVLTTAEKHLINRSERVI